MVRVVDITITCHVGLYVHRQQDNPPVPGSRMDDVLFPCGQYRPVLGHEQQEYIAMMIYARKDFFSFKTEKES